MRRPAVFLDRDGVLIEDRERLVHPEDLQILPGVPEALARLKHAGYALVVVSNQTVVARGFLGEDGVRRLEAELEQRLCAAGAPVLDGFYFCPHHPNATVETFRIDCDCRKPRPGLLLSAARELDLDLARSFMVGDRPSDVLAGVRAGCRTIQLQTGQHEAAPIETREAIQDWPPADHVCPGLPEAAAWIEAAR